MVHMRNFKDSEVKNMEFLVNKSVKFTQVQITHTGLKKSILDATAPMRTFFMEEGIHDYKEQLQGALNKVYKPCCIISEKGVINTKMSLYRPKTKKGDPRLWVYKLKKYTKADDIHVIFNIKDKLYVINMTQINFIELYQSERVKIFTDCINQFFGKSQSVAEELLEKLKSLTGKWHKTVCSGDTAVGRTVEFLLGLGYNPKKEPDYKGIELKSNRKKSKSQKCTMFGSFPDWDISAISSKVKLLEKYGELYHDGIRTVFQTTATSTPNNKNIYLSIDKDNDILNLLKENKLTKKIVSWRMEKIHNSLLKKHKETFWIDVETEERDGDEYMRLKKVEHTKNPNIGQFDILLEQGIINLDVVVGRAKKNKDGKTSGDDNWNFRISKKNRPLLFPKYAEYILEE